MQKYSPISDESDAEPSMREDSERGTYYWCADVDARIDELEKALREATLCDDCGCACRKVCVNQGCDTL